MQVEGKKCPKLPGGLWRHPRVIRLQSSAGFIKMSWFNFQYFCFPWSLSLDFWSSWLVLVMYQMCDYCLPLLALFVSVKCKLLHVWLVSSTRSKYVSVVYNLWIVILCVIIFFTLSNHLSVVYKLWNCIPIPYGFPSITSLQNQRPPK